MPDTLESLARDELDVTAAAVAIQKNLAANKGEGLVYASLCRWAWRAMVERRFGDDLRDWHRLFLDTSARVESDSVVSQGSDWCVELDGHSVSERLRALADLLRMSVEAMESAPKADLTRRAHVVEILDLLKSAGDGHVGREELKGRLNLRDANLSRVLTLMTIHGLIERQPLGRKAEFCLTSSGRKVLESRTPRLAPVATLIASPEQLPTVQPFENKVVVTSSAEFATPNQGRTSNIYRGVVQPAVSASHRTLPRVPTKVHPEAISA